MSYVSITQTFGPFVQLQDHVNLHKRHQNRESEYLTETDTDRPVFYLSRVQS
jgi:hypothetical protein